MKHKSGFVNIIGNSNVGKSTLMNTLLSKKLSITTHKQQTTKNKIIGIINNKKYQIIISDNPGIILYKKFKKENIIFLISKYFEDADIILYIIDYKEILNNKILDNNILFNNIINYHCNIPKILLINKIDILNEQKIKNILNILKKQIFNKSWILLPISAKKNININFLFNLIINYLPEHPPYYDNNIISNKSRKFFVNEIIREKILLLYNKEIPYSINITTEIFKEYKNNIIIYSNIYVKKNSQKIILIGNKGNKLNVLIKTSIKSLEDFFKKKILINLYIKLLK